jgi:hypothetical protein
MSKGQDTDALQDAVKNLAIAFAYDNIPDLKMHRVEVNARDCALRRVIHRQRVEGPGEAIDTILPVAEWKVSMPLKIFSSVLIITAGC